MDNAMFELLFAMLSVATLTGTLFILVARLAYSSQPWAKNAIDSFSPIALPLAAAITTTCMLGSLYFSEVVHYLPCRLCWFQRAMMYPLAIILLVATALRYSDRPITGRLVQRLIVALATIGALISSYHWFEERFPNLDSGVCDIKVPCSFVWFEKFGFVTLAFMAFTGFLATIVFSTLPKIATIQERQ